MQNTMTGTNTNHANPKKDSMPIIGTNYVTHPDKVCKVLYPSIPFVSNK